jgi:anti-anti-sigma factor
VQGEVGVTKAAVTTRTDEHTLGIVLAGDITDAETADLRTMLVSAMKADADEVVVDLAAATALDSTAVGALLAAVEIAADQHVRFRIHCPSPTMASTLEAVGLAAALSAGTTSAGTTSAGTTSAGTTSPGTTSPGTTSAGTTNAPGLPRPR